MENVRTIAGYVDVSPSLLMGWYPPPLSWDEQMAYVGWAAVKNENYPWDRLDPALIAEGRTPDGDEWDVNGWEFVTAGIQGNRWWEECD